MKKRIRGPIMSIPTPFTADFAVDYEGVRKMVRLGQMHGIAIYELTAGNSQYHALSYEEIKELTRVLVEAVGGKGIVIAATGPWWTGQAVDYARFAESVGADAVQVMFPMGTSDGYVEHIRRIAANTRLGIVLQGEFTLSLLERLVQIPSVVSMKEDQGEKFYVDAQRRFGQRLAIFCGGQKWRFLVAHPYGSN
ncbi:MAG TPA: dihydrodipicolinate synthase family protein, partial [Chthonomonadales bacterium]|nr:dihydrodipicolinate synthase family protein [Chthonomonadales bacterium]